MSSPIPTTSRPAGPAARLTTKDILDAAQSLDLTPAHVRAVIEVESRGRGFHPESQRPIILFEPHVFHRDTRGLFAGVRPDLSYARQGEKPYPKTQDARYVQLRDAIKLDEAAALRSTSWGLFQIMGFNHELAGHQDLRSFVHAMAGSEREQLNAFCAFLLATGLVTPLRQGRWASFARGYNGRDYARHGYDQRLKAAYARHSRAPAPARVSASPRPYPQTVAIPHA